MSLGGPKEQVVTNKLDPQQRQWNEEIRNRSREAAEQPYTTYGGERVAGMDPAMWAAQQGIGGMGQTFGSLGGRARGMQFGGDLSAYDQAGRTGAMALGGDQGATSSLMNPYISNVINSMGGQYDRMRDKATMGTNSEATGAGAFGGSRHALLEGERLGAIDRSQMEQTAGLLHSGFNDAMGRAGSAAQLGLGAGDQRLAGQGMQLDANGQAITAAQAQQGAYRDQANMGDYNRQIAQQRIDEERRKFEERRDWGIRGLDIMTGAANGLPYGTSQHQPLHRNVGAGILGGAASGAATGSMIPGVGTAVGAGVGGLLGLFG